MNRKRRIEVARKGGLATAANRTPEERSEAARHAVTFNRTPEQRSERARKAIMTRWRRHFARLKRNLKRKPVAA